MAKYSPVDKQLSYIFSSSELVIFYMVLIYSIYYLNLFTTILFFMIIMKTVVLSPIKKRLNQQNYPQTNLLLNLAKLLSIK